MDEALQLGLKMDKPAEVITYIRNLWKEMLLIEQKKRAFRLLTVHVKLLLMIKNVQSFLRIGQSIAKNCTQELFDI